MKEVTRNWIVMGSIVGLVAAVALVARALQNKPVETTPANGIAVLELYTSEGCSSCPAADDLLGLIAKQSRQNHSRIYPMEFHVDTWDQPAFSDPFSEARFTKRQEAYFNAKISREVYTPQAIINGSKVAIGSDADSVRARLDEAMRDPVFSDVALAVARSEKELTVDVNLSAIPAGGVLNLALVERGLVHEIPKGENAGRTLHHENVVRAFSSTPVTQPKSSLKLRIPDSVTANNCSVVAYVQDSHLAVVGAAEAAIP